MMPAVTALTPAESDPIFDVITEHCAAMRAFVDAAEHGTETAKAAAGARDYRAHLALLTTAPQTVAGVIALLEHLATPEYGGGTGMTVLRSGWEWAGRAEMEQASDGFPRHLAAALNRLVGTRLKAESVASAEMESVKTA